MDQAEFTSRSIRGASKPGASKPFEPVTDLYAYLQGCWCRNLEWREFGGGFRHLHSSNTLVVIEAVGEGEGEPQPEGTRLLRWSFGKSLAREDLHEAYVMKLSSTDGETSMEWEVDGHRCSARFWPASQLANFEFLLGTCTIFVTYRLMQAHMMAINLVEVDAGLPPTVQFGNMMRIDAQKYHQQQESSLQAAAAAKASAAAEG